MRLVQHCSGTTRMAISREGGGHFLCFSAALARNRRRQVEERKLLIHLIKSWIHEIDLLAWFEPKYLLEFFRPEQQSGFIQQVLVS